MTLDTVFNIVNSGVLPFWIMLIIAPKWQYRNSIIYMAVAFLAIVYMVYILTGPPMDFAAFGSLQGVKSLFSVENAILIGWVHYLAFDLLVGNWITNEAQRLGIKHSFVIPCLFFCLMFGPVGFLLFTIIKLAKTGRVGI